MHTEHRSTWTDWPNRRIAVSDSATLDHLLNLDWHLQEQGGLTIRGRHSDGGRYVGSGYVVGNELLISNVRGRRCVDVGVIVEKNCRVLCDD